MSGKEVRDWSRSETWGICSPAPRGSCGKEVRDCTGDARLLQHAHSNLTLPVAMTSGTALGMQDWILSGPDLGPYRVAMTSGTALGMQDKSNNLA